MSQPSHNDIALDEPQGQAVAAPEADGPFVQPEHAELLLSLDRMLTVGSYYPPGHEKYKEVAEATQAALRRAAAGSPVLALEIADDGVRLAGSFAPADAREARRLHDLLNPLNIALLEIDAAADAAQLHEALSALRKHHGSLSGARSYQEITVDDLPPSVRAISRSLYVKTHAGGAAGAPQPFYEAFDPGAIPEAALVETPEGQKVEREFLAVIKGIMQSGDPMKMKQLENVRDEKASDVLAQWIPDQAIAKIKEILESLDATNSDPMMLQHLIGHAQAALELTGDPELVELVFSKLRKEGEKKKAGDLLKNRPKPRNLKRNPVTFTMTREQMRELIDEVDSAATPIADLMADTGPDCLGIAHQVLITAPSDTLAEGAQQFVRGIIASDSFGERDLKVLVDILRSEMRKGVEEDAEVMVRAIAGTLRELHPVKLGWMWLAVWEGLLETEHKEMAWPYVVNDLLQGLQWVDPADKLALYQELSDLQVKERVDLLVRLEQQPALQEKILADDLFDAPAPLLYPVHQALLRSSLSEEHGPRMIERLRGQKSHRLIALLLKSLDEYDSGNIKLYQAMLDQGVVEKVTPTLADAAGRYLKAIITRLDDSELKDGWIPEAIDWLGRLQAQRSEEVLEDIVYEKKWLFFPVWPKPCREAARVGLERIDNPEATAGEPDEE